MERKAFGLVASVVVGLSAASSVQAAGPDMTPLLDGIDFGSTTTAVLSIAALLAVVYIAREGVWMVLNMLTERQATREAMEWESERT
jgi:hypothetical protein